MRPSYFSCSAISVLCASVFPGRANTRTRTRAPYSNTFRWRARARQPSTCSVFSYDEQRISYRFPARGLFCVCCLCAPGDIAQRVVVAVSGFVVVVVVVAVIAPIEYATRGVAAVFCACVRL